jgi:hypothetical protein
VSGPQGLDKLSGNGASLMRFFMRSSIEPQAYFALRANSRKQRRFPAAPDFQSSKNGVRKQAILCCNIMPFITYLDVAANNVQNGDSYADFGQTLWLKLFNAIRQ